MDRPTLWFVPNFNQLLVIILEIAFCSGFIIVILSNMEAIFPHFSRIWVTLMLFPFLTIFSWIRWLKDLWLPSTFGALVYLVGVMGVTYYNGITEGSIDDSMPPALWTTLPLFCGTAVYSLEGINVVLPVESSMSKTEKAPLVIGGGTVLYALSVTAFGAFGYAYGFGECGIITDCLPPGITTTIIRVALSISLVISHPITLYPATEILEDVLFTPKTTHLGHKSRLLRTFLVLLTCIIAASFRDFAIFSNLIGCVLLSIVGFIIPPALHMKLHWEKKRFRYRVLFILNTVIIILGIAFMIVGSITAFKDLIENFSDKF